jgi:hypothetical protein
VTSPTFGIALTATTCAAVLGLGAAGVCGPLAAHQSIETTERYIDGDTWAQRRLVAYV